MKAPAFRQEEGEKRGAVRVRFGGMEAAALVGGASFAVRVLDLSRVGARLHLPAGVIPGGSRGTLAFGDQALHTGVPFAIVRKGVEQPEKRAFLQVRFDALEAAELKELSGLIVPRFAEVEAEPADESGPDVVIEGLERVGHLLKATLIAQKRKLRLHLPGLPEPLDVEPLLLDTKSSPPLLSVVLASGQACFATLEPGAYFSFPGEYAVYHFDAELHDAEGAFLRTRLPDRVSLYIRRINPRIRVKPGDLSVRFSNPHLSHVTHTKDVLELSLGGFSFAVDLHQDILFPGENLAGLSLCPNKADDIQAGAVVRSLRATDREGNYRFGVALDTSHDERATRDWLSLLFRSQYPKIALGAAAKLRSNIEILVKSGYVTKTKEQRLDELLSHYEEVWTAVLRQDSLGTFFVCPDPEGRFEGDIGTVSLSRAYSGSWVIHQLAIDRNFEDLDKRLTYKTIMHLYSSLCTFTYNSGVPYFVAELKAFSDWSRLVVKDFCDSYTGTARFFIDVGDLYFAPVEVEPVAAPAALDAVRVATDHDRAAFSEWARTALSPLEYEALEYDPAHLDLAAVRARYGAAGLFRGRVLLAYGEAPQVGYAVCEMTEPDVNLFGLFNRLRLVLTDVPTERRDEVTLALISAARREYAKRGVHRFIFVDYERPQADVEDPRDYKPKDVYLRAGFTYVEALWRWVSSRDLIPSYRNHMSEAIAAFLRGGKKE